MRYLFVGGFADGQWREVGTCCLYAEVVDTTLRAVSPTDERAAFLIRTEQYAALSWSDGKNVHRIFSRGLTHDEVFQRLMANYRPADQRDGSNG